MSIYYKSIPPSYPLKMFSHQIYTDLEKGPSWELAKSLKIVTLVMESKNIYRCRKEGSDIAALPRSDGDLRKWDLRYRKYRA